MNPPSPRESDALQAICEYQAKFGYFPSVREIGQMLGLRSPGTVQSLLDGLERKRYLRRRGPRAFTILKQPDFNGPSPRFVQQLTPSEEVST